MAGKERRTAPRLLAVIGSLTPPGRLRRAVEEAVERIRPRVASKQLIDLHERQISFADGRDPETLGDDTGAVVRAIANADVVVFATPVYRGSMTGALKNLFDLLPAPALQAKVIAPVAMGASDHHFLGADRHMRDVLAFFGAVVAPVSVYLTGADFIDGAPAERTARALDELLGGAVGLAAAIGRAQPRRLGPESLGVRAARA